ncbi:Similar to ACLPREF: Snake venom metalloproteinase ACLF (Agkistrodon contortrix laticinctus), partial [Cotesia congregata]
HRDGIFEESTTAGLSAINSACSGVLASDPHGGIIYDKGNYRGILTAAHELGHVFGANHDSDSCAIDSIMAERESPSKKTWSECSKKQFQDALQIENFSCMYNKPLLGNSSSTKDLEESVADSKVLLITPDIFNPNKLIVISHKKSFIKVWQIDRDVDDEEVKYNDLHVSIPGTTSLIFDPRIIEPTKMIIINYIKNKIHINTVDL